MGRKRISRTASQKGKRPEDKFRLDRRTIFVIVGSLFVFLLMSYLGLRSIPSQSTPPNGNNTTHSKPSVP